MAQNSHWWLAQCNVDVYAYTCNGESLVTIRQIANLTSSPSYYTHVHSVHVFCKPVWCIHSLFGVITCVLYLHHHTHNTNTHAHSDLYGLVLFLNMEPYSQGLWYRRLITEPYLQGYHRPMIDLFSTIMWRNAKEDVAEEVHSTSSDFKISLASSTCIQCHVYMCKPGSLELSSC